MDKKCNVLIVDDHPLITHCFKNALQQCEVKHSELQFTIRTANDCDSGNYEIERALSSKPLDLVFLDIRIPPSKDKKFLSGEDLGIKIKSLFKTCKIVVLTSLNDNFRLNNIIKNINPDGLLIKQDIDFSNLVESITTVLFDPPYYSKDVLKLMRVQLINDFTLDSIDRRLLHEISIGSRMKDLPGVINLSISALERRKRKLKSLFEADDEDEDKKLIQAARAKGFI